MSRGAYGFRTAVLNFVRRFYPNRRRADAWNSAHSRRTFTTKTGRKKTED